MALENWIDVIEKDFPRVDEVTREMVEAAACQSTRYNMGARIGTGRFSTTRDLEARRREALKPLNQTSETDYTVEAKKPILYALKEYLTKLFS